MECSDPRAQATSTAIIAVCAALMTIGVVMVASASVNLDRSIFELGFWRSSFGRQIVFVVAGFLTIIATAKIGRRMLAWSDRTRRVLSLLLLLVSVLALVAVLIPGIGKEVNGARRWIELGPAAYGLRFQPSELAKLALVIGLAALLSRPAQRVRSFRGGVLPCAIAVALTAGLVGSEDFGTAVLLAVVGGLMLLVGGCRLYHLILLAAPALAGMWYLIASHPYRIARLAAFRNIWEDPRGAGYHPVQSLVTIASGGWFGRGLGAGIQKYGYLPESRTDFIFSVICEEMGIVGAVAVIFLFVVLLWLGARAVVHAPDAFGYLAAFGVTLTIGLQAAMNIAVVTVCVPTKGIALPLVSAGGSGIVFLGVGIGLLAAVAGAGTYTVSDRADPVSPRRVGRVF